MGKGIFESFKEGWNNATDEDTEQYNQEKEEKKRIRKQEKKEREIKYEENTLKKAAEEVQSLIGSNEEVLFVHKFWNDKMIATNKKLIYIDLKVAKNKTFAMIPFNRITSYALTMPTGLAVKTKLKIFTGGDRPSIEIEAAFDEGMKGFCKVLAEHI